MHAASRTCSSLGTISLAISPFSSSIRCVNSAPSMSIVEMTPQKVAITCAITIDPTSISRHATICSDVRDAESVDAATSP